MMLNNQPFIENKDAGAFAQAIVDIVREPLLVLDRDLRVLAASRLLGVEYVTERRGSNAASLVAGCSIASEMTRRSDNGLGRTSIPRSRKQGWSISGTTEPRIPFRDACDRNQR
jgi:hypothetical protein